MVVLIAEPRSLIIPQRGVRKPARPVLDLTHPLSRSLVGCWLLGDGAGTGIYKDISPSGFNGVGVPSVGSISRTASHHGGLATAFANSSALNIDIPCPDSPFLGALSIVAWVNVNTLSGYNGIFSKSLTNGGSNNPFEFRINITTGTLNFVRASAFGVAVFHSSGAITAGAWFQVGVVLFDGIINTVPLFFINGLGTGTFTDFAGNTDPCTGTNHDLWIANRPDNAIPMNGSAEGLRIYNRALSRTEWAALYAEPYAGIYETQPSYRVGAAVIPPSPPTPSANIVLWPQSVM